MEHNEGKVHKRKIYTHKHFIKNTERCQVNNVILYHKLEKQE
jgi:hypothetical protein